jgi:uncharacterized protein YbaP (TraB family)
MLKHLLLLCGMAINHFNAIAQIPKEKTLLWEISGKGIKQPSFLFGTIHVMCPEDLKVSDIIRRKFNATKQLFLEIDMDDPEMMTQMIPAMVMKDSSIDQLLDEATFDSLNHIFQSETGLALSMMKNMKPIMLMSLIYPSVMGCQPESWEKTFQDMAKERKIKIHGLEKLEDQVKVLGKIPYRVQAEMLVKTMFNIDSTRESLQEMLKIYKNKDINKLNEITTNDKDFGDYEGVLLNDRNKKWIPVIINQSKEMPSFFACGAGHLGGKNGIINLLRGKGYIVKPIMYN